MIRTVITPLNTDLHLLIPKDYVGKKVEVLLFSIDEPIESRLSGTVKKNTMGDFWNILNDNDAKELRKHVEQSRKEWERDI